jgi:predicted nucleic acid binding AN1-type Zn finger protein
MPVIRDYTPTPAALPLHRSKKERCSFMGCRRVTVEACRQCKVSFCLRHNFYMDHSCKGQKALQKERIKALTRSVHWEADTSGPGQPPPNAAR